LQGFFLCDSRTRIPESRRSCEICRKRAGAAPVGALQIGDAAPLDPGAATEQEKTGYLSLPFGELWSKGISVGAGQAPAKTYQIPLRNLIITGKAKPSMIITDRVLFEQAPDVYAAFQKRDKVIKPVLKAA
jgi:glutathione-independent formaldehyde dehydrogenase